MRILAINKKGEHIGNAPNEEIDHIPNKGDSVMFKNKKYKVLSRYFQYRNGELEIVNVYVRDLRRWDKCL